MIYRNGVAVSTLVEFATGFPDGPISWAVYDETGAELDSGTVAPVDGMVSTNIIVPSEHNTLSGGALSGFRDLVWSYMVGSEVVNGDRRYTIEAPVPWGASHDGVRSKLGIEPHELPNGDISLVRAYYDLVLLMGEPDLTSYTPTARERLALSDAVEAVAALSALPTLQMRAPIKESSGTDTYQRHPADWELLANNLRTMVTDGILILLPTFDPLAGAGAIFLLATPTADAITGA